MIPMLDGVVGEDDRQQHKPSLITVLCLDVKYTYTKLELALCFMCTRVANAFGQQKGWTLRHMHSGVESRLKDRPKLLKIAMDTIIQFKTVSERGCILI
jgi:hypothetical protein